MIEDRILPPLADWACESRVTRRASERAIARRVITNAASRRLDSCGIPEKFLLCRHTDGIVCRRPFPLPMDSSTVSGRTGYFIITVLGWFSLSKVMLTILGRSRAWKIVLDWLIGREQFFSRPLRSRRIVDQYRRFLALVRERIAEHRIFRNTCGNNWNQG